jgi:hypothetical protein
MKPYGNDRRHYLACDYGCCSSRKARIKARALKKGARQAGTKECVRSAQDDQ